MEISKNGIEFIKHWEGFRPHAYKDLGDVWTIGYGSTLGVKQGQVVFEHVAHSMLMEEIHKIERVINSKVTVPLTQNQFDALVAFVYNIGVHAFTNSTALKVLNKGDYRGTTIQMERWNKVRINKTLVVAKGLQNRRKAEIELFERAEQI